MWSACMNCPLQPQETRGCPDGGWVSAASTTPNTQGLWKQSASSLGYLSLAAQDAGKAALIPTLVGGILLVSSSCHNKIPQTGCLEQKRLFFLCSGGWESRIKVLTG